MRKSKPHLRCSNLVLLQFLYESRHLIFNSRLITAVQSVILLTEVGPLTGEHRRLSSEGETLL